MLRFTIFGIPVAIQPFFWVVTAIFGGALSSDFSRESMFAVVLFILAAFASILIHELGHAVVGRKLGGGYPKIVLTSFGGLAYNEGARLNQPQRFWMIIAGPGAGFMFFLFTVLLLCVAFNGADVMALTLRVLFGMELPFQTDQLINFLREKPFVYLLLRHILWINFWWGIINLLPVMPLDGGQITNLYVRPQRLVFLIGMIAAIAMAALGLVWLGSIYTAVLFGYLAWVNFQNMKAVQWQ